MISVAILGASGRMGRLTKDLVDADANLKLHAAMDSSSAPQQMLGADVVIDFTNLGASEEIVRFAVESGMKVVVGTSGWSEVKLAAIEKLLNQNQRLRLWSCLTFRSGRCCCSALPLRLPPTLPR